MEMLYLNLLMVKAAPEFLSVIRIPDPKFTKSIPAENEKRPVYVRDAGVCHDNDDYDIVEPTIDC